MGLFILPLDKTWSWTGIILACQNILPLVVPFVQLGGIFLAMMDPESGLSPQNNRRWLKTYNDSYQASDIVTWLVNKEFAETRYILIWQAATQVWAICVVFHPPVLWTYLWCCANTVHSLGFLIERISISFVSACEEFSRCNIRALSKWCCMDIS